MIKRKHLILIVEIIIIVLFLSIWEILSSKGIINSFILSSPSKILKTIINLSINYNLLSHILTTLKEILISFSLGFIIAFIISVILYSNKFLNDLFDPFLTLFNSLPKVALGPIIIIWVGANTNSIILMAILTNTIISIITMLHGFINTDPIKIKLFKSFNANYKQILFKLVIPSNISTIISSFKINISLTLIGVIMGEFLVSKKGIGYLILYGTQVFDLNIVMAGLVILLMLSYGLYKIVLLLNKKLG